MEASPSRGLAHRLDDVSAVGAAWVGAASTAMVLMVMVTLMVWLAGPTPTGLQWQSGKAVVRDEPWSATIEGTDIKAFTDVPLWFDALGFAHDRGWPTCLEPAGAVVSVRFALTPEPDNAFSGSLGAGVGSVAAVDCRQP